ncbi:hypothetical protein [Alicyclobacillus sp. ALC3]|uniref:hypothetical protein n=1 Tax=Alicyclobacillus sp. ALC3 TaxID=2796143 RepID=UPI00237A0359|nr:hypothetical protein [Alicyclobacillus sp. ALC3]WDL96882.1 hypothetical protein JC200_21805 [Alicyclobacillus sp. ALC3]
MSKASERSAARWRTLEAALVSCGPDLYKALQRGVDSERVSELWISAFVRGFESDRELRKASNRYLWLVEQVRSIATEQGVSFNAGALLSDALTSHTSAADDGTPAVDPSSHRSSSSSLQLSEAALQIPQETWNGLRKRLLARDAAWDAESRRRGASWSQYAVIAATVVGLTGVVYGIVDSPTSGAAVGASGEHTKLAARLPQPLTNLPTVTDAQFRLGTNVPSLTHAYVTSDTLYLPQLTESGGVYVLTVYEAPFSAAGGSWSQVARTEGKLVVKPPAVTGKQQGTVQLSNWRLIVSGRYAVAVVSWTVGQSQLTNTVQVYQLDLLTGRSKLLKTLSPTSNGSDAYVTAVGNGKVVVQPGILEGLGNSAAMVGLPIQEYTLDSTSPDHVLAQPVQIPGTFGLMEDPAVTTNGIVFQGIYGQAQDPAAVSATWYQLSWDGSLATLQGPPLDNQQHWAVTGKTGQLWWVETTPAASGSRRGSQVLMGRLTPLGAAPEAPADTLSGPVLAFGVSGSHLVWVQKDANITQMVVSEVTQ